MPRDKQDAVMRKKRARISKEPPLPIPIASVSGAPLSHQTWYCYTGYLQGSTVVIKHSGDMDFLHRMGFFGKGTLSRSEPNFESRRQKVNIQFPEKDSSLISTRLAVSSKRSYVKHLQYKALEDDNESEYNALVEQEMMQRYIQGEDEEKEEEFDEEEDEEGEEDSDDSDDSFMMKFAQRGKYASNAINKGRLSIALSEISSQSKSFLSSILARVSQRSKENIATFIRVPLTLRQLETKFQRMQQQEASRVERVDHNRQSSSRSVTKSGSQDVIDLVDLDETDDIVILNSDDNNSKDSEDENVATTSTRDDYAKSWDDPKNKGDTSFWEMDPNAGSSNSCAENEANKGKAVTDSLPSSDKQMSEKEKGNDIDKENGNVSAPEPNEPPIKTSFSKNEGGSGSDDKVLESQNSEGGPQDVNVSKDSDIQTPSTETVSEGTLDKDGIQVHKPNNEDVNIQSSSDITKGEEDKPVSETRNSEEKSSPVSAMDMLEKDVNSSHNQCNSQNVSLIPEAKGEDSNDSDDVICIEAESAKPEKLHTFLSQASAHPPVVSKLVRFMTNISKEAKFVNAKVAFRSWTDILHFNFSGDKDHLPTSLEVIQDSKKLNPSEVKDDGVDNEVYERLYPPVETLVAQSHSKGVVIKQRLEEIPSLDEVIRNVLYHDLTTRSYPVSSNTHHPQMQLHYNKPSKSNGSHVFPLSWKQKSGLHESEKNEALSLNSRQFSQYFQIFHRTSVSCDKNVTNGSSMDEEANECLMSVYKEIDNLGEFSQNSQQTELKKKKSTKGDPQMLRFNSLISEYLTKLGISLIKELVLLKILVCGSIVNCSVPSDVIVNAKASLSQEEMYFLFERLDFVQSCLTPASSSLTTPNNSVGQKNNSEDVIMIDLSDEESNDRNVSSDDRNVSFDVGKHLNPQTDHNQSNNDRVSSQELASFEINNSTANINEDNVKNSEKDVADEGGNILPDRKRSRSNSGDKDSVSDSKRAKINSDSSKSGFSNDRQVSCNATSADQACSSSQNLDHLNSNGVNADKDKSCEQSSSNEGTTEALKLNETLKDKDGEDKKESPDSFHHNLNSTLEMVSDESHPDEEINILKEKPEEQNSTPTNEVPKASTSSEKDDAFLKKSPEDSQSQDMEMNIDHPTGHDEIYIESSDEEEEDDQKQHGSKSWYTGSKLTKHSYSKDNLKGDLFVIPNTSDEDEDENSSSASGFIWQPCIKKDPFPSTERLHLLLEEAFFLTFGLGCLTVLDSEKKALTITEMWQQFPLLKDNFIPHYVAYHYFRSKGWVPKSGLKFGCDFVLYREGPPFFHGSYSVVVVAVREDTLTPMIGDDGGLDFPQRLNSWITLSGINRVTEHVAKELMYCYVICPKSLTEEESKSPKCISQFRVKEVVVSRWVSSKERESKEKEEMP